ncbi:class D beta-lactamase [Pontiellaceae bacterium B12219]|nr:class D beta-lactamase [Pontiellaceae bacterium B12219]
MRVVLAVILCFSGLQVRAQTFISDAEINVLFRDMNVEGTFVVFDAQRGTYTAHDPSRAEKQYVPASTFKIANSLIGLAVGAVKNVDEVLPYGGEKQPVSAWENDMSLREAIAVSNVPVYQELARRIGLEQMQKNISMLKYGNGEVGTVNDKFWLEGPLKISAVEQTEFLAKLAKNELPFSENIQTSVRDLIKLEEGKGWVLYGKTGWAREIGWWVGWVERSGAVYSFALNMDMKDIEQAPLRVKLGKDGLRILGILD